MIRAGVRMAAYATWLAIAAMPAWLGCSSTYAQTASGWQTDVKTKPAQSSPRASRPRASQLSQQAASTSPDGSLVRLRAAALASEGGRTIFTLDLTGSVGIQVYTLANPHRVVIDLPELASDLPAHAGRDGRGLVSKFRYGQIEAGKTRVVLDLAQPARIEAADLKPHGAPGHTRLQLRLAPVTEAVFISEAAAPQPAPPPETRPTLHEDAPLAKGDKSRAQPVIVIDPGHGGVDPGAIGSTEITEKAVVLAVARQVAAILGTSQRYKVLLTRETDVFVGLDKRVEISRHNEADLFVSIHADAVTAQFAQAVRGATIYTLSEKPSDERARLLAERENAADVLAGIATMPDGDRGQVAGILIDLLKRETANFSHEFSGLLAGRLRGALSLAKEPQRGAAFRVLKQTQSPSVLIELGYMTNPEDERQLMSAEWQRKVAQSIAAAIDAYFAKRLSGLP